MAVTDSERFVDDTSTDAQQGEAQISRDLRFNARNASLKFRSGLFGY
jgi:hypothetical protein